MEYEVMLESNPTSAVVQGHDPNRLASEQELALLAAIADGDAEAEGPYGDMVEEYCGEGLELSDGLRIARKRGSKGNPAEWSVKVDDAEKLAKSMQSISSYARYKSLAHYRFTSLRRRELWLRGFLADRERSRAARAEKVEAKRRAREAFVNPYRVEQLFYTSWGYDQTNVDWFECVSVGPRSVKLRPIAENRIETSWMAGTTTPRRGVYVGEPFTVIVQVRVNTSESTSTPLPGYDCYLPAEHGSYYPSDGQPKGWSSYH